MKYLFKKYEKLNKGWKLYFDMMDDLNQTTETNLNFV